MLRNISSQCRTQGMYGPRQICSYEAKSADMVNLLMHFFYLCSYFYSQLSEGGAADTILKDISSLPVRLAVKRHAMFIRLHPTIGRYDLSMCSYLSLKIEKEDKKYEQSAL